MGKQESVRGPIVERVPARAALAGNPSDGFGGAVCGVPVHRYAAEIRVESIDRGFEVGDDRSRAMRFGSWTELEEVIHSLTAAHPHCLVLGSIATAAGRTGALRPFRLHMSTTIPMSVGLAGSSAIVIATLRAMLRWSGDAMTDDELALTALAVETHRLRIPAGLQDRVVQVRDRPILMQFDRESSRRGPGLFTALEPVRPIRLLIAHRIDDAEPSQVVHHDLRTRFETDDGDVRALMRILGRLGVEASEAFATGDVAALGAAMDSTLDVRASMLDLAPAHVEMVDAARSAGAWVNYTGSGGAIVALGADDSVEDAAAQSLRRLGCEVVSVEFSPGD